MNEKVNAEDKRIAADLLIAAMQHGFIVPPNSISSDRSTELLKHYQNFLTAVVSATDSKVNQ